MHTTLWWLRHDLRLHDNPALAHAAARGRVIPVYILDEETPGVRPLGGASRWWLHHSLAALGARIPLVLRRGRAEDVITALIADTGARSVVWNRCYEPWATRRDAALKTLLRDAGIDVCSFNGSLLAEPWDIRNQSGHGYKVFTPFWKQARAQIAPSPLVPPFNIDWQEAFGDALASWGLLPTSPDWARGFAPHWHPGEDGASERLNRFLRHGLPGYADGRDRPDLEGCVSRLSPHLHWGEIAIGEVWRRARAAPAPAADIEKFLSELGWREFAHHLLYDHPDLPERNWKPAFDAYPWADNPAHLRAWQKGLTGYPLVDAGLRQLWATGWMHNRVRMVAASFLVKHLRLDWRHGEAWFWDTLLDADLANNVCGWQWVAGCGADAAPYFRIFNPTEQGRRFDPHGTYIRTWCPELSRLPDACIHAPWEAPAPVLQAAGVILGQTYPHPLVDHAAARTAALAAYAKMKTADV